MRARLETTPNRRPVATAAPTAAVNTRRSSPISSTWLCGWQRPAFHHSDAPNCDHDRDSRGGQGQHQTLDEQRQHDMALLRPGTREWTAPCGTTPVSAASWPRSRRRSAAPAQRRSTPVASSRRHRTHHRVFESRDAERGPSATVSGCAHERHRQRVHLGLRVRESGHWTKATDDSQVVPRIDAGSLRWRHDATVSVFLSAVSWDGDGSWRMDTRSCAA